MESTSIDLLAFTTFKLSSLAVGLSFAYMGYKLFIKGIWGNAGTVEGEFKDTKIVVKKAAPGTFFALFGTIILCFTIFQGFHVSKTSGSGATRYDQIQNEDTSQPKFSSLPSDDSK